MAQDKIQVVKEYTINPNTIVARAASSIKAQGRQKILGLLVTGLDTVDFYFAESEVGNNITSRNSPTVIHTRQYLLSFYQNMISLNDLLVQARAKLITTKDEADLSLAPEDLSKDTILNLLIPAGG